jgi:hypothetical protein
VKIIGLTEYAYGYHADAMEKAGAAGVYQKSKATEELYAAIKKLVGKIPPWYGLEEDVYFCAGNKPSSPRILQTRCQALLILPPQLSDR